ncbi:PREDICTED: uncharacterized protein LOC104996872 [Bison bison bison]|uniref:Uncharacterized protein LOC104996872 n=1 Tax=Bison bison bison TaxID=43346 RepID=A0A6P3ICU6_BISBB|nr:PREDICTED: uncharacterized protein LOC104996872 [Bison bison bison]
MTRFGENPGAFSHQSSLPTSKPQKKSWRRHPGVCGARRPPAGEEAWPELPAPSTPRPAGSPGTLSMSVGTAEASHRPPRAREALRPQGERYSPAARGRPRLARGQAEGRGPRWVDPNCGPTFFVPPALLHLLGCPGCSPQRQQEKQRSITLATDARKTLSFENEFRIKTRLEKRTPGAEDKRKREGLSPRENAPPASSASEKRRSRPPTARPSNRRPARSPPPPLALPLPTRPRAPGAQAQRRRPSQEEEKGINNSEEPQRERASGGRI